MKYLVVFNLILILSNIGQIHGSVSPSGMLTSNPLNTSWIENKGQYDENVVFHTNTFAGNICVLNDSAITYFLNDENDQTINMTETFNNTSEWDIKGVNETCSKINILKNHPSKHLRNISSYEIVDLGEIWPKIEVKLLAKNENVEKLFMILPGGDYTDIELSFKENTDLCIRQNGELQLDVLHQSMSFTKPVAWQIINDLKVDIQVGFRLIEGNDDLRYGFELGLFDQSKPVFIDPLLASTYFGGSSSDELVKIVLDESDNVYVLGKTRSLDIPVTGNAFDQTYNAADNEYDIFLAKLSAGLNTLESCTYIGGNDDDHPLDMAIDAAGNVFICGYTYSQNYPGTAGSWNPNHEGENYYNRNAIISKFNADLSVLSASTFISDEDGSTASAIVIDNQNKVIIAGTADNPIAEIGPQFQNDCVGTILIKFSNNLNTAEATNSIGNDGLSLGPSDILIDHNGDFVGVNTLRYDNHFYITTIGCYQSQKQGGDEGYVFKLNSALSGFRGATYFGGSHDDECYNVAVDEFNNIYICGKTKSNDLPITGGTYDTSGPEVINNSIRSDGFVTKFNQTLTQVLAFTFTGVENFEDYTRDLLIDESNKLILFGKYGEGMQVACNSFQQDGPGNYIFSMNNSLQQIISSTYIRGSSFHDRAESLSRDHLGNIIVAGRTNSTDFPVLNAYESTKNDGSSVFISKITQDFNHGLPCCTWLSSPPHESFDISPTVLMEWHESLNATGYAISIGTEEDKTSILDNVDIGNVLTYQAANLPCEEKIYVRVDAYNENGIAQGQDCFTSEFYTTSPKFQEEFDTICEGEILYWEGFPLYYEGRFRRLYPASNGCDSILQMNLTVIPSFYSMQSDTICEGDSILWFGNFYKQAGLFLEKKPSNLGCDSIFELDLHVEPTVIEEMYESFCDGESFYWEDMQLNEPGEYSVTFQKDDGCDSIRKLFLHQHPSYAFFDSHEICEGSTLWWHGQNLTEAGTYFADYITSAGCDSVYTLNLILNPEYEFFENLSICEGEMLEWHGELLDSAGIYEKFYQSKSACDSIYYLNLQIAPQYSFFEDHHLCPNDTLTWQGMEFSESGTYEALYESAFGCDSNYFLNLISVDINPIISSSGDTLFTQKLEGAEYQWFKCPEYEPIVGGQDYLYIAEESGSYAVEISLNSCQVLSDCIDLIHSDTEDKKSISWILYPNPTINKSMFSKFGNFGEKTTIEIFDLKGTKVWEEKIQNEITLLNLDNLDAGIYLVTLQHEKMRITKKLIIL